MGSCPDPSPAWAEFRNQSIDETADLDGGAASHGVEDVHRARGPLVVGEDADQASGFDFRRQNALRPWRDAEAFMQQRPLAFTSPVLLLQPKSRGQGTEGVQQAKSR